jgi:hypothetical protein
MPVSLRFIFTAANPQQTAIEPRQSPKYTGTNTEKQSKDKKPYKNLALYD